MTSPKTSERYPAQCAAKKASKTKSSERGSGGSTSKKASSRNAQRSPTTHAPALADIKPTKGHDAPPKRPYIEFERPWSCSVSFFGDSVRGVTPREWWLEQTMREDPWNAVHGTYLDGVNPVCSVESHTGDNWSTTANIDLESNAGAKL